MILSEAVDYYHSLEKFGIQPGLERIGILCERLGSPHKKLKFIHVAGTNGKGSTCTALASVLTSAGYHTGLYTSPYVIDFRERIQLDMKMISPDALIRVTETVRGQIEQLAAEGIKITEFEAVTAAAFLFYYQEQCDFVVLETGLGGRFDATNIIENSLCSILTSVSLDHVNILGNTLREITFEKCGIIKNGCPVITGSSQSDEVLDVIRAQVSEKNCKLYIADSDSMFDVLTESICGMILRSKDTELKIPYPGKHQLDNMSLVLTAVNVLRKAQFDVSDSAVQKGISSFRIPARTEIIAEKPLVILDGSHNDGSTAALADAVKKYMPEKKISAVLGMMADKDCEQSLSNILPLFSNVITVKPSNPRSMPAFELALIAERFCPDVVAVENPLDGIDKAISQIDNYDALVVCGSLYLAGDVRDYLINKCGEITAEK